ncbi:ketopantoate reductase family protein [Nitrospirillum iridis]|uniref:2-dehydropantoate 2-reductase n=1 Tax=Nitrospirillum iridis TaxID=765888 RepID=A0A7X0B510_9PROT|nr:ketopantoate reductase family protein [Nitrospirillum iridis]MBB6255116.1 2-dehydropantoate 2-reductase [Nitrospirillum iridis]
MNIGVMGAGAVGCFYGALLARAGHAVTLVGRPALVRAVRADGLRLEMRGFDGTVAVDAVAGPEGLAGVDLVLFCVKSADTEEAGRALLPHLKPGAVVLALQNGVDNADRLAAVLGRPVVPVVVYVATDMAGAAHVRHHGRGDLILGPGADSERVADLLRAAAIPATVSAGVTAALWDKLIINCAYNALSAVAQVSYGTMVTVPAVRDVMADVVAEAVAVARAWDIAVADDILERVMALAAAMPNQLSSTAQDLARGKASEIDYLNGHIVRQGAALGIATPANRALLAMVKLLEAKAAA